MPTPTPYVGNELHLKAKASLAWFYERAVNLYGPVIKPPILSYNLRGTCAGLAVYLSNEVRLNPVLFRENPEFFLSETIPHELAHLLAFKVYGHKIKPHGAEWKSIMRSLGVAPKTTHSLDLSSVQRKRPTVSYRCACDQTTEIPVSRHQRVQRAKGRFVCKTCSKTMTLATTQAHTQDR